MATVKLSNGYEMPEIGLGTWQSKPGEVKAAVKAAIDCGYRLIDCAYIYGNEAEVGAALAEVFSEGKVSREDLFIISKLWNTHHHPDDVRKSLQKSLDRLGLKYVDLYLLHWPIAFKRGDELFPKDDKGEIIYEDIHYLKPWKVLEECVDEGLIRSLGLSNFNSQQIQDVLDNARIKPTVLQIEIHPYFQQHKLVEFCQQRNIVVIAFSCLGSPARPWSQVDGVKSILEDDALLAISGRLGKTPAQVVLRWLNQRGIVIIPKSVTPARIQQNLQIFDFELSTADMDAMKKLDKNLRLIVPLVERNGVKDFRDKDAPYFPFLVDF
jgi:diketogulonate reductase-like aldo/keto reductase